MNTVLQDIETSRQPDAYIAGAMRQHVGQLITKALRLLDAEDDNQRLIHAANLRLEIECAQDAYDAAQEYSRRRIAQVAS